MDNSFHFDGTASSELQFKINQSIIFNYLRFNSPISRAAISRDLKISAPAVSRVIEKLIREKIKPVYPNLPAGRQVGIHRLNLPLW